MKRKEWTECYKLFQLGSHKEGTQSTRDKAGTLISILSARHNIANNVEIGVLSSGILSIFLKKTLGADLCT